MHTRGILHGDLYAHNILHTPEGDVLLSDFGAAAFFDVNDAAFARGLEKLEVRALGCLLEELAAHLAMRDLAKQCLHPSVEQRPSLSTLCNVLMNM